MSEDKRKLTFNYIKSPSFETRRVDGAYGGVTPGMEIFLAAFCERPVIPEVESYSVQGGKLGQLIPEERIARKGIVREVQVGLTMSVDVAKDIARFIQEKIDIVERIQQRKGEEIDAEQADNRD